MTDNLPGRGVGENRSALGLDRKDPEGIASFLCGLGYDEDNVVNALVTRCNVDWLTARAIVRAEAAKHN